MAGNRDRHGVTTNNATACFSVHYFVKMYKGRQQDVSCGTPNVSATLWGGGRGGGGANTVVYQGSIHSRKKSNKLPVYKEMIGEKTLLTT